VLAGSPEENLLQVPLQEFSAGPVSAASGQVNNLPGLGIELIAIAEVSTQARADHQSVARIDTEIPAVEQGVDI
jgi:hypothetical protein